MYFFEILNPGKLPLLEMYRLNYKQVFISLGRQGSI